MYLSFIEFNKRSSDKIGPYIIGKQIGVYSGRILGNIHQFICEMKQMSQVADTEVIIFINAFKGIGDPLRELTLFQYGNNQVVVIPGEDIDKDLINMMVAHAAVRVPEQQFLRKELSTMQKGVASTKQVLNISRSEQWAIISV